ncbi:MAG: class II fructose-bisphosphate aldolase, partial [Erysipelotrichaceae bacterium]|nr:class II fructose-bisphosphate aldolase [Erysipelotrichaceae bacterium]
TYENCVLAIKAGYTSMMADRSKLPFEENAAQCAELCKMAHAVGMSFEAELGHVGFGSTTKSIEDVKSTFTRVDEAVEFVKRTDVDCLAVAVGTIHGHYPKGIKPDIQFGLIEEIRDAIKIPLVLHGCSGTGDENLAKAARLGVAKFNIGTENVEKGWAALEEALAKAAEEKGKPLGGMERYWVGEDAFLEGYKNSIKHYIEVLGCKDKA